RLVARFSERSRAWLEWRSRIGRFSMASQAALSTLHTRRTTDPEFLLIEHTISMSKVVQKVNVEPHNKGINLTARPVTRLAWLPSHGGLERERARRAPVQSAGYARRYAAGPQHGIEANAR